jgi:DNA invertase Pin-like site-specific DNA recombinase
VRSERKRLRCAIYTRKSSEEGLEQSFNSLDAQREACAAYVESQRHEGWKALETRYDDGGYSGGSMVRPALQGLLADIDAGKVDVVVVYKVDRLTRSLADFAKIIERFDARGVSFVSVTQQFNTAGSMGRLTLNVLLSFAQFEREVTGERIRDKIAASKKKGLWMGGVVPLGYEVQDRKLVVNSGEATIVRTIFRQYLALGCVRKLQLALKAKGLTSKRRMSRAGRASGGTPYSRGALYKILQNRVYLGEIAHRGALYPGEHVGIISRALWERVASRLRENTVATRTGARAQEPSLLAGVLFDDRGYRLTPSHCVKGGTRYRYYFSQAMLRSTTEQGGVRRVPAGELEALVVQRLATFLASGKGVLEAVGETEDRATTRKALVAAGRTLAASLPKATTPTLRVFLLATETRVTLATEWLELTLSRQGLRTALLYASAAADGSNRRLGSVQPEARNEQDLLHLRIDARLQRWGAEIRLVVAPDADGSRPARPDTQLIKAIARGRIWYQRLVSGEARSLRDLAEALQVNERYVSRVLRAALLAPDIVEAILEGRQSPQLSVDKLRFGPPLLWDEQRQVFGFSATSS